MGFSWLPRRQNSVRDLFSGNVYSIQYVFAVSYHTELLITMPWRSEISFIKTGSSKILVPLRRKQFLPGPVSDGRKGCCRAVEVLRCISSQMTGETGETWTKVSPALIPASPVPIREIMYRGSATEAATTLEVIPSPRSQHQ